MGSLQKSVKNDKDVNFEDDNTGLDSKKEHLKLASNKKTESEISEENIEDEKLLEIQNIENPAEKGNTRALKAISSDLCPKVPGKIMFNEIEEFLVEKKPENAGELEEGTPSFELPNIAEKSDLKNTKYSSDVGNKDESKNVNCKESFGQMSTKELMGDFFNNNRFLIRIVPKSLFTSIYRATNH